MSVRVPVDAPVIWLYLSLDVPRIQGVAEAAC